MADSAAPSLESRISSAPAKPEQATNTKKDDHDDGHDDNLVVSNYDVAVKLADLQADPNNPLYSVKSFDDLGLYVPYWL